MGFFINDYETELRQHLNLSTYAWVIINNDIMDFYPNESERSLSGFLNRVFANFNNLSNASISKRLHDKEEEIDSFFNDENLSKTNEDTKKLFKDKYIQKYCNKLVNTAKSYQKGIGKKFRINKANVELLRDSEESDYYKNSIGAYLKAMFEEYSRLSNFMREQIFFKDTIDLINFAISKQLKLKITLLPRTNINHDKIALKFYVSPYKILQDKSLNYNYLVGYSEQITNGDYQCPKTEASFRVSRIDRITVMSSMNGFISKENKQKLEQSIIDKDVRFLSSDLESIKIKFTEKGLELFNKQLYMRPMHYEICKDEPNTFIFFCTEIQAMDYFFKIGKHIEILEPISLREKFKSRYIESYQNYVKKNEK